MQAITTTPVDDLRLLDLPGYHDLMSIFSDKYDSTLRIESLPSLVTRDNLLLGASLAIEHEFTSHAPGFDMQKAMNMGNLTLLRGEYGSLSVRIIDMPAPPGVCSTVLQDTLIYPLHGGPLTGWLVSLDDSQPLDEFRTDVAISRSDDVVLSAGGDGFLFARGGYDALNLKTEAPAVIVEFCLHPEKQYSWVVHESSRRPIRLLVQETLFNHHEMMLSYLAYAPKDADYADTVRAYADSPCHFVRWAAYSYLLRTRTHRDEVLERLQRDPHPQIQGIAKRLGAASRPEPAMHA